MNDDPRTNAKDIATHLNMLLPPTTAAEADIQREQLLEWKLQVETDLGDIQQQISEAKARAFQGDYSDPDWFQRANHSLRMKKRLTQQLQGCLTKLKRLRRELYEQEQPITRSVVIRFDDIDADAQKDQLWRAAADLVDDDGLYGRTFRLKLIEHPQN
jgi:hypothetical protein